MIISHKYKFIFIKTRKTAGTSLEIALSKFLAEKDIITPISDRDENLRKSLRYRGCQHYHVPLRYYTYKDWARLLMKFKKAEFKKHMPASEIKKYVDTKMWKSYYKFCVERNPWDKAISMYYWRIRSQTNPPTLEEFLEQALSISDFEMYTLNGEIAVNKILRFENLTNDLKELEATLQLPSELILPKAKGSVRKDKRPYQIALSSMERSLIEKIYAREIEHFGYTFD